MRIVTLVEASSAFLVSIVNGGGFCFTADVFAFDPGGNKLLEETEEVPFCGSLMTGLPFDSFAFFSFVDSFEITAFAVD